MVSKRDRAFAWFGAILFLGTSSALTVAVIIQLINDNKKPDPGGTTQSATSAVTSKETPTMDDKQVLQGTKLAGFTPVASVDKLQAIDTVPGTGDVVKAGDTVTVDYTGAVAATGVIFQSSLDSGQPVSFGLNQVIKGWTDGVPGMKVGGTRRLVIPYAQAYGEAGRPDGGIPAKADLVFDITLKAIVK